MIRSKLAAKSGSLRHSAAPEAPGLLRRQRLQGSILLISLSLVSVLTVMAIALARSLALEVRLTRVRLARAQAQAMARSGIYLAMQRLTQDALTPEADEKTYDWYGDDWAVFASSNPDADSGTWVIPVPSDSSSGSRFPGVMRVRIADEAGKLPLNRATEEQLARLLGDASLAHDIVDAIDPPDPAENRPDDTPPYFPKNAPLEAVEELTVVDGMTVEGYHILESQASPHLAPADPVNINTASEDVLRAMGLTENAIQLILQFRAGSDGEDAHLQDGVFPEAGLMIVQTLEDKAGVDLSATEDGSLLTSALFGVESSVFMVTSEGVVDKPAARARITAVVRRTGCQGERPSPCIIAWREG